jgi:DNA-binding SARP family transcriptional activator
MVTSVSPPALTYRVLGPLEVERDGTPVRIAGQRPRSVLALLLVNSGRVLGVGQLIRAVWGEDLPDQPEATLQVHVSNLRKLLAGGEPGVETQPPGYVVRAAPHDLDLLRFDELVRRGEAEAGRAPAEGERLLAAALSLWRGPALADLDLAPGVEPVRTWLEDRRLAVVEDRFSLLLTLGRHRDVISGAEAEVAAHPLREPLWEALIVALYRAGRQADALAAYGRARSRLLEDLGIEPGARLRALELAVLNQDPALDPTESRQAKGITDALASTARVGGPVHGRLLLDDGSVVAVTDRVTIGRHPECDIHLSDPVVSRRHAEIRPTAAGCLLVDTSSNGTRVGGSPVAQRALVDGDVIEIGAHAMTFREGGAAT